MNVMLQHHDAKRVYPVPDGLRELACDISREVLRHQPENIYGFIADYLETMLAVREKARDAGEIISDIYMQGYFLDCLYRTKGVTREDAERYATIIQANWRGYVVRKKLRAWLKKKKKIEEEKRLKRQLKIEEYLALIGITMEEADRAAGIIQQAYRESRRRGRWGYNEFGEEVWLEEEEGLPFGQRIRELDRAKGRYERYSKVDFGDFFDIDEVGEIIYRWPRVGQLRKVPRDRVPPGADRVDFFAMRDLRGEEQYSFLKGPIPGEEVRGIPVGFLIPMPKLEVDVNAMEVVFVDEANVIKMGEYTYIYQDEAEFEDLEKFYEILSIRHSISHDRCVEESGEQRPKTVEVTGEDGRKMSDGMKGKSMFDYDPRWVVPRALVRIQKRFLTDDDDEVRFAKVIDEFTSSEGYFTFRAETVEHTGNLIQKILSDKTISVKDALLDASHCLPYSSRLAGRFIPVPKFRRPKFIQKIIILPESDTGEAEVDDLDAFEYLFLPLDYKEDGTLPPRQKTIEIPMSRFQGYHRDYQGSVPVEAEGKVFVMGPLIMSPSGKAFTHECYFWEEFGIEAWYRLLHELDLIEAEEESTIEEEEYFGELQEYEGEGGKVEIEMPGEGDVALAAGGPYIRHRLPSTIVKDVGLERQSLLMDVGSIKKLSPTTSKTPSVTQATDEPGLEKVEEITEPTETEPPPPQDMVTEPMEEESTVAPTSTAEAQDEPSSDVETEAEED